MWVLYFAASKLDVKHLTDEHGLPGVTAQAFRRAMRVAYPEVEELDLEDVESIFATLGFLYIQGSKTATAAGLEQLLTILDPPLKQAKAMITQLNRARIELNIGAGAAEQYAMSVGILAPDQYAVGEAEIVKRLPKRGREDKPARKSDQLSKASTKDRKCRKCKKDVPKGITMAAHRLSGCK